VTPFVHLTFAQIKPALQLGKILASF